MKRLLIINILMMLLTGCTAISSVRHALPREHDPALAYGFVTTKIEVSKLDCKDKSKWERTIDGAIWLNSYAEFREDPQLENVKALVSDLNKANQAKTETSCKLWLDLANERIVVLNKVWGQR